MRRARTSESASHHARISSVKESFSDNLTELEALREDLESMLAPEPGWEWAQRPRRGKSSMSASGGVVVNRLQVVGAPDADGAPTEPGLAITIAQGGAADRRARQCRPVAYDRDGNRYLFKGGSSGSMSSSDEDYSVSGAAHYLHADVLREQDIAFLGIEVKAETDGPG